MQSCKIVLMLMSYAGRDFHHLISDGFDKTCESDSKFYLLPAETPCILLPVMLVLALQNPMGTQANYTCSSCQEELSYLCLCVKLLVYLLIQVYGHMM